MRFNSYDKLIMYTNCISYIKSRSEIDTSCEIFGEKYALPLIPAPMMSIVNIEFCDECINNNILCIVPRFYNDEEINKFLNRFKNKVCYAIGTSGDDFARLIELYCLGCRKFCLDVANSSSFNVSNLLRLFQKDFPEARFIIGNTMSMTGVLYHSDLKNIEAVRLGVGGGLACSTEEATGMWRPETDIIKECAELKNRDKYTGINMKLIADGGIRSPKDFCKAIGLGADLVMAGSIFVTTKESASEVITLNGVRYKSFSGSASFENQLLYKNNPRYIEGKTVLVKYEELALADLIKKYKEGLQSSMSYANSKDFESYRESVIFEKV